MKFAHVVTALALAASAGAQAQAVVDMNARLAASGSLVSSVNPVTFSIRGGLIGTKNLVITDNGAGYASNLNVTLQFVSGNGSGGFNTGADAFVGSDTCTGATLAPNGTCTIKIQVDGGCPKASSARWNLLITSANAPTLSIPVTVNSQAGICE